MADAFTCPVCSKKYHAPPSLRAKGAGKTCSRACAAVLRRTAIEKQCNACGRVFEARADQVSKGYGNYCSKKCWASTRRRRIAVRCSWCEKSLEKTPYQVESHRHHFCDLDCTHAFKKRFGNRRSRDAFTNKQKREWLGDRCARCGATENLELDHIVPRFAGGTNSRDNAQTLCRACNRKKFWDEDLPLFENAVVEHGGGRPDSEHVEIDPSILPQSRKEALGTSNTHYFTSQPCKRGHIASRYTSTGQCVECMRERKAAQKNERRRRKLDALHAGSGE